MALALWIEDALLRFADRKAVTSGGVTLSYFELNKRSLSLAHAFRARGVKPGGRVALHLEKSVDAIAAIIGAVRLGAAYVPLDPRWPAGRKQQLLRMVKANLLVTTIHSEEWNAGVSVLNPLEIPDKIKALDIPPGSSPAYILFTSGSSGIPKAAEFSQNAAAAFARWAATFVELKETDTVGAAAAFHFDLSTFDIFSTLGSGARLVLLPAGIATFPLELGKLIQKEKISVFYSVPSTLRLLEQVKNDVDLSSLRAVLCAGDVFPVSAGLELKKKTGCRLFNFFGPTETNVCTAFEVPMNFPENGIVPVGFPAAEASCLLLQQDGTFAESGEGELVVAGPSLMNGYTGDVEANRAVFRNFPDGRRGYRTGDRVKKEPQGPIYFLGRSDGLVKCFGHRVHPLEVELALGRLPGVKSAVVVAIPDPEAGSYLHALVVPAPGVQPDASQLIQWLGAQLPSHFLPKSVRFADEIPLTDNGKTDRQAIRRLFSGSQEEV